MRFFSALLALAIASSVGACGPLGSEGAPEKLRTPDAGAPNDGGTDSGRPNGPPEIDSVAPGPSAEDTGGGCPELELPAYADLADNPKLPDPFSSEDGSRIESASDWTCRRAEIGAEAQEYELGPKPRRPVNVTGSFEDRAIVVTAGDDDDSLTFSATITLPTTGSGPYPAIIGIGGQSLNNTELADLGIASIRFPNDEIAQQTSGSSRGLGKFYELYGTSHGAGAMMAWAIESEPW